MNTNIIRNSKEEYIINQPPLAHCVTRQKIRSWDKEVPDINFIKWTRNHIFKEKNRLTRIIREKKWTLYNTIQPENIYNSGFCLLTLKAARRGTPQWHRYKMVNDPKGFPSALMCTTIVWRKNLSSYLLYRLTESSYINWQHSFTHKYILNYTFQALCRKKTYLLGKEN